MSLFNFFRKSPKKGPVQVTTQSSTKDIDGLLSPQMQKKRHEAAVDFLKAFHEKMPLLHGKPHPGTVLAVAGRLAGTSLYRSMNYKNDAVPGVIVLSEEVDLVWPQLMNLFAYYCKQNGFDILARPILSKFPEKDEPLMDTDRVLQEYQDQYHESMKKYGLDYLNGARAGIVIASIIFFAHCVHAHDVDPYVAVGIVGRGIVEGAKTAPPPLRSESVKTQ